MTVTTTEETVREVLGKSYDQFGFQGNTRLVDDFVYTLNDPSMVSFRALARLPRWAK